MVVDAGMVSFSWYSVANTADFAAPYNFSTEWSGKHHILKNNLEMRFVKYLRELFLIVCIYCLLIKFSRLGLLCNCRSKNNADPKPSCLCFYVMLWFKLEHSHLIPLACKLFHINNQVLCLQLLLWLTNDVDWGDVVFYVSPWFDLLRDFRFLKKKQNDKHFLFFWPSCVHWQPILTSIPNKSWTISLTWLKTSISKRVHLAHFLWIRNITSMHGNNKQNDRLAAPVLSPKELNFKLASWLLLLGCSA